MDTTNHGRMMVESRERVARTHRGLLGDRPGPLAHPLTPARGTLLLQTIGCRSGMPHETWLSFFADGDDLYVVATDGASGRRPDWYANLLAFPEVEVDVKGERSEAWAETVTGDDRTRLWRKALDTFLGYAYYQRETDRELPLVRLRAR